MAGRRRLAVLCPVHGGPVCPLRAAKVFALFDLPTWSFFGALMTVYVRVVHDRLRQHVTVRQQSMKGIRQNAEKAITGLIAWPSLQCQLGIFMVKVIPTE